MSDKQLRNNDLLSEGLALHQQGKFDAAWGVYKQILRKQPTHFDALHLSGAIALQNKQLRLAVSLMRKAIRLNPNHACVHSNLGLALQKLGRLDDALVSYGKALAINPKEVDARYNRANALQQCKRFEASVLDYDHVIAINPSHAQAYFNRGKALQAVHRWDDAVQSLDRAIELDPSYGDAYSSLGAALLAANMAQAAVEVCDKAITLGVDDVLTHNNRGAALQSLGRWEEALASYDQALALDPNFVDAYFNRGVALQSLQRVEEALASYDKVIGLNPNYALAYSNRSIELYKLNRLGEALTSCERAIAINSDYADAHYNRGVVLQKLQRPREALMFYDRAIALKPDYASAYANRGLALLELKRPHEALVSYDQAIELIPNNPDANWNKGLVCLTLGNYKQGWPLYEWGWQNGSRGQKRNFSQPLWLGAEVLAGRTILLYQEQGLGDVIQFSRFVRQVKALGARVLLEVPKSLLGLMQSLEGVDELIEPGAELPQFDYQTPLGSLPLAFKTEVEAIPDAAGYVHVDEAKRVAWQARLGPKRKPRVGVVWSSASGFKGDASRSMTLEQFVTCLDFEAYEVVCLQKVIKAEDKAAFDALGKMAFYGDELEDFADTAALASCMDLVISTCTSVPHLTAALGIPTWVLLQYVPDWRWLLDRSDSPWYSSVRLFRQSQSTQWGAVLADVLQELQSSVQVWSFVEQGAESPRLVSKSVACPVVHRVPEVKALFSQGLALHQEGAFEEAKAIYEQVLVVEPNHFDALQLSGAIELQKNNLELALEWLDKAISINANSATAYSNRGLALQRLGRLDESLASFDKALAINPQEADAYFNRGVALQGLDRLEDALASYDKAIQYRPDFANIYFKRATALKNMQRFEEALRSLDQAKALGLESAELYLERGWVLQLLRRFEDALVSYDQTLAMKADDAVTLFHKSLALLSLSKWRQGWALYENRWVMSSEKARDFSQPLWLGQEDLTGKTCLLYQEQGLGDVIQFCRYARHVKALGAKVLLEVPKCLLGLMQTLEGVDVLIEYGVDLTRPDLPPFDYQVPLGSLPLALKTEVETIPDAAGYLRVNEAKRAVWQERLGAKRKPRVGVVWSSVSGFKDDAQRSMKLEEFAQCLDFERFEVVCLQKVIKAEDQAAFDALGKMTFYGDELEDFADTAALASCMDLVISTCTSVPHLTAALGIPTWVLLQYVPDWRWLLDRSDSPWYSSVRLFRQSQPTQWGPVLAQVFSDAKKLVKE